MNQNPEKTTPTLSERMNAFSQLGAVLSAYNDEQAPKIESIGQDEMNEFRESVSRASFANPWFTHDNISYALNSWAEILNRESLEKWVEPYSRKLLSHNHSRKVAVVMAGNIPLVGLHDFICTLISGNHFIGKLSKDDNILLPAIANLLLKIEPSFIPLISFTSEKLDDFDAVIATGSDNTSRYFEYYFSKYPHIIRKNRNGIAVLTGDESTDEMEGLAEDICLYFGLGCRNISKVYIPVGYEPSKILEACEPFRQKLSDHFKYMNNYLYQKTIQQMNLLPFHDNGFILMKESSAYSSPVAVVNYEYYDKMGTILNRIVLENEKIQCVAAIAPEIKERIAPGHTQRPHLWDYADGVDTMQFLLDLEK